MNIKYFSVHVFIVACFFIQSIALSQPKTFIREYTYTAGELDSKIVARTNALEQVKKLLLEEIGVYVHSNLETIKTENDGEVLSISRQQVISVAAGIMETKIIEESWDGKTYFVKVSISVDPEDIRREILKVSNNNQSVTGNPQWDFRGDDISNSTSKDVEPYNPNHQNPFYNSLYSLVIPGAGQYHSERYTKAAIFLGAEVALIAYAIMSDNSGNKKTEEFERYAEAHWSAERYARWIEAHGKADYGPTTVTFTESDFAAIRNNYDFSKINAWEQGQHNEGFSHQLPKFREQQYYELIGKYRQFKFGWDEYPKDAQGIPLSDNKIYDDLLTADDQITNYATERARANDYYYAASFAVSVLVINHVVSAIDAYLSTKSYNNEISATLGMRPVDSYEGKRLLSELKVSIQF